MAVPFAGKGTADMKHMTQRLGAAGLAAASLGFAAAAMDGVAPSREVSFIQSVAQMRWGHGALDWLLPDYTGDRNGRKPEPRA